VRWEGGCANVCERVCGMWNMVDAGDVTRLRDAVRRLDGLVVQLERAMSVGGAEESVPVASEMVERENRRLLALLRAHPPPRPTMLPQRRLKLAARQQWRCAICDEMLSEAFHADHRVPWSLAFDDSDEAIDILCVPCHLQKTSIEASCRSRVRASSESSRHDGGAS
jgi:5-methylcytosine-specific restriction endonuclease McrA